MHFTTDSYDYHKYHGKTKTGKIELFEKRNDKYSFEKLARNQQKPFDYLLANLVYDPKLIPIHMTQKVYDDWRARTESLSYTIQTEIKTLDPVFLNNLKYTDTHPTLFRYYLAKRISPETITIIIDVCNLASYWDNCMNDDIVYKQYRSRIIKYAPFLTYDKPKIKSMILKEFA